MSAFSSNAGSSDTRAVRPKMQRRPAATYGTKARRIARPSTQAENKLAEPSSSATGSKNDANNDSEDEELKERPAKRVQRGTRAFTVARDTQDDNLEVDVAPAASSAKPTNAKTAALRNKSNIPTSTTSTSDKYLKGKSKISQSDSLSSLDEDQATLPNNLPIERLSLTAIPNPSTIIHTNSRPQANTKAWTLPIEDKDPSDQEVVSTSTPAASRNKQFTFNFQDLHAPTIPFLGDDTHLLSDDDLDTTVRAIPQTTKSAQSDTNTIHEQSMLLSSESNSTTDDELATMTNRGMGIFASKELASRQFAKAAPHDDMPAMEASDPITGSDTGRTDEEEDGFASDEATQKTEKQEKEAQLAKIKEKKLRRKSKSKSISPEKYRSSSNSSNAAKESKIKLKSAEKKKRSKVAEGNKMEVDGKTPATTRGRKTRSSSSVSAKSQAIYGTGASTSTKGSTTTKTRATRSQSTTSSASSSTTENQQGLKMRGSKGSLIRSTPVKAHSSGSADELGF